MGCAIFQADVLLAFQTFLLIISIVVINIYFIFILPLPYYLFKMIHSKLYNKKAIIFRYVFDLPKKFFQITHLLILNFNNILINEFL
jgi:hypothetical protein